MKKMKAHWIFVLPVFFGLLATGSVFAHEEKEVDFGRLNPVLQSLVDATIAGDDLVEFARPTFDVRASDFAQEQLKYDLTASLRETPWLPGGHAEIEVSSTYATHRETDHFGIAVAMRGQVRTDVLALARHAGRIALEKSRGHNPRFAARIIALLRALSQVQGLTELASLVREGQALAIEILDDKIATEMQHEGSAADVASYRAIRASYQATLVETILFKGVVVELRISNADSRGFVVRRRELAVHPGAAALVLTSQFARANLQGFAALTQARLDDLKERLRGRLLGANEGNPADLEAIRERYVRALVEFKRVARGLNNY